MSPATKAPPLRARPARFDLSRTPLHWIPGDPYASHLINVLSLIVPVGERWFMNILRDAKAYVDDERLAEDVRGFMGQESSHSRVHEAVLAYMRAHGIETEAFVARLEWFLNEVLGPKQPPPGVPERWWIAYRVALVSAAEQLTAVLGNWVLDNGTLDEDEADPVMLDLLRWHGAEEIEHCAVAFDLLGALAGPWAYPVRALGMSVSAPVLIGLWHLGLYGTVQQDGSYGRMPLPVFDFEAC
ncbi:MAG TPA: metal-dependent hydrolase, partial [Oscillatoriaceae cyanobacterium]